MREKKRSEQKRLANQLGVEKSSVPDDLRGKVRVTTPKIQMIWVRNKDPRGLRKFLDNRAARWTHLGVMILVADHEGIRLVHSTHARVKRAPNPGDISPIILQDTPTKTPPRIKFTRPATVLTVMVSGHGKTPAFNDMMHTLGLRPETLAFGAPEGEAYGADHETFFEAEWNKPRNVTLHFDGAPFAPGDAVDDFRCAVWSIGSAKRDKHIGQFALDRPGLPNGPRVELQVAL